VLSGQEAIDYIQGAGKYTDRKTHPFPSYIITDLKMGDRDGLHVLEFIKKNPARSIIPVVMLSGSADPDDVRHAYLLGASSYFVKPSQPEALQSLVKAIHEYWSRCAVPEVDEDGFAIPTDSVGKPGQRYSKPTRPA
jgi:CheY-like chemotaxis protein